MILPLTKFGCKNKKVDPSTNTDGVNAMRIAHGQDTGSVIEMC